MRWSEFNEDRTIEAKWAIIGDAHARMVSYPNAQRLADNDAKVFDTITQAYDVEPESFVLVSAGHNDIIRTLRPNIDRIGRRLETLINVLERKGTLKIIALIPPQGTKNLNQDYMMDLRNELKRVYREKGVEFIDLDNYPMDRNGRYNNRGVYIGLQANLISVATDYYTSPLAPDTSPVPRLRPDDEPTTGNAPGQRDNIPQYPAGLSMRTIEQWITEECELRGIEPQFAIRIFRNEGYNNYQSTVTTGNQLKRYGREASYGPFQLYVGRGLGNDYESRTGRDLRTDNTREGIRNQIRFALDMATRSNGWGPWYGRIPAGVGKYDGLASASAVNNWS